MAMAVSICMVRESDRARLLEDVAFAQAQVEQGDGVQSVVLGEQWETVHLALTGERWKAGAASPGLLFRAVLGECGASVEAVDCGFGPGRLLDAATVKDIARELAKLPTTLVAQRLLTAAGATAGPRPRGAEDRVLRSGHRGRPAADRGDADRA